MILLLASCGSDAVEQAQVDTVPPTSIPTTAPLSSPTSTPVPAPTSTPQPIPAPTAIPTVEPLPTATVAPVIEPTATASDAPPATVVPVATAVAAATAIPAATEVPAATVIPTATVEVIETPTTVPTPAAEETATETPTAVVAVSGELPLECFDRAVQLYRGFVEGVDALAFEGGRVYCGGAATNAVSAARSYRHSSGLVVQRNPDYIFDSAGTGYINFSGTMHFCVNGQAASAAISAATVPALLVVIDSEAQRQVAQGAVAPAAFAGASSQC